MTFPTFLKTSATVAPTVLGFAATVAHPPWQAVFASLSTALLAWVHARRPGDVPVVAP